MSIKHTLFIHSPADVHLGCFQLLAVIGKFHINIRAQAFTWILWPSCRGKFAKFGLDAESEDATHPSKGGEKTRSSHNATF